MVDEYRKTLTIEDCPLIPGSEEEKRRLVDLYNRIVRCLGLVEPKASDAIRTQGIAPLWHKLADVNRQLRRHRYQVGFLGPFQVGKSRTFNNLLNISSASDFITRDGAGDATTAAVTRLWPKKPPKPDDPRGMPGPENGGEGTAKKPEHLLQVRWLTPTEYDEKREHMCTKAGFDPSDPDSRIQIQIPRMLDDMKEGAAPVNAQGDPIRILDLEYLALLLKTKASLPNWRPGKPKPKLCDPRSVEPSDGSLEKSGHEEFQRRTEYLNHPPRPWHQQDEAPSPLVADVVVHYWTEAIPETLEMIDLPGLGSACSVDTFLTEKFIGDLDGALVFCSAANVDSADVDRILARLKKPWEGKFRERLWMVYTRCDTLSDAAMQRDDDQHLFRTIFNLHSRYYVPLEQACLVTNEPTRLTYEESNPKIQALLAQGNFAPMRDPWRYLHQNGGIDRLRQLIAHELADQVARAIRRGCDDRLRDLARGVWHVATMVVGDAAMPSALIALRTSRNLLRRAAKDVAARRGLFDDTADDLKGQLDDEFKNLEIDPDVYNPGDGNGCRSQWNDDAAAMERKLSAVLGLAVKAAYQEVRPKLENVEANRDRERALRNVFSTGLSAWWDKCALDDAEKPGWIGPAFPSFDRISPFSADEIHSPYTGKQYIDMMEEKIKVVSQQAVQRLRHRTHERVKEAAELVTTYIDHSSRNGPDPALQQLKQQLTEFEDFAEMN